MAGGAARQRQAIVRTLDFRSDRQRNGRAPNNY
jgi:hypothetical protein